MITESKTEYEYLLVLLAAGLNGQKPAEKPEHLDFAAVFKAAKRHEVANLAYYGIERLEKKPEPALLAAWSGERDVWIIRDMHQQLAKEELAAGLCARGIPYIETQGVVTKQFYPQSDFRSMSDIDLVAASDDFPQIKELLGELGYSLRYTTGAELNARRVPDICLEIHGDFLHEDEYAATLGEPFACCDERGALLPEYHYLHSFLHFCKHYFAAGCGLRHIMDIYLLNQKLLPEISKEWLFEKLEALGLTAFYRKSCALADMWFDPQTEYKEQYTEMEGYIFACGVYGNKDIFLRHELQKRRAEGRHFVRSRYVLSRLFPSVEKISEQYCVKKYKRLCYIPLVLWRIISVPFGKLPRVLGNLKDISKTKY